MRERTTWNRNEIKTAAMPKQADPYLMNQDHVSKNPPADKYMNGTPSSWAEDVHTPNEWEKEYSGGQTKRNEIGEAEFRPETFSEKSATTVIHKKADLCVKVARMLFKTANDQVVEDQAVALMALPDSDLIDTFQRLAQDQEGQQESQKPQEQQATTRPVAQDQGQQGQEGQESQKPQQQAAQQGEEQAPAQDGMQQQSGAYQAAMQQCVEAMQSGDQQKMQAAIQQMVQDKMQQQSAQQQGGFPGGQGQNPVASTKKKAQGDQGQGQQGQGQPQQQQAGMDQQAMQSQIQSAVDQAVQAMMQQQGQQQVEEQQVVPDGMQQQASDDELLNDMLAPATASEISGLGDLELEAPVMDTGDVLLGPEDAVLHTLFASQETEDAQNAQDQQGQQHQAALRAPALRTVGTRPTAGVGRIGGSSAANTKTASNDIDKLSNLWNSAPDVREHFGMR